MGEDIPELIIVENYEPATSAAGRMEEDRENAPELESGF